MITYNKPMTKKVWKQITIKLNYEYNSLSLVIPCGYFSYCVYVKY